MTTFTKMRFLATFFVAFSISCGRSAAENWPQFRGPSADGVSATKCPIEWSDTGSAATNIQWKVPLDGEGWSSPVIWGDNVFLTAATPVTSESDTASRADLKPEEYRGGGGSRREDLTDLVYRYEVICLDARNGSEIWRQTARQSRPTEPRHSSNTYATESPITDGERVYAYFGMNGVYCYDMKGNLQWTRDLGSYEMRAGWGTSSSPVLFDGALFLQVDNEQQSFLVALDAESGDQRWKVDRDEKSQYSSPFIWKNSIRSELIVGGMIYRSHDPSTGKLLWQLDMSKGRSSASPVSSGDRLYIGTELRNRGGTDDGGGFLFSVKPGGVGDITPAETEDSSEFIDWKIDRADLQMASPTICQGYLYLLERRSGNLHCIDSESGTTAYRKRISGARAFWASPWTDGRHVYCVDSGGTTFVLSAGGSYDLISKNAIDEQTWSTPGVSEGRIFFRTVDHLYCIGDGDRPLN